jgi:ketosteroid isomerase-like protein
MAVAPEQIKAACDAYVAAYRANDKDALLALHAEDCEWTDPVGTPICR